MSSTEPPIKTDDMNSEVWRFFSKHNVEAVAMCELDDCLFSADTRDEVSMWSHLEKSHKEIYVATHYYETTAAQSAKWEQKDGVVMSDVGPPTGTPPLTHSSKRDSATPAISLSGAEEAQPTSPTPQNDDKDVDTASESTPGEHSNVSGRSEAAAGPDSTCSSAVDDDKFFDELMVEFKKLDDDQKAATMQQMAAVLYDIHSSAADDDTFVDEMMVEFEKLDDDQKSAAKQQMTAVLYDIRKNPQ